MSAPWVESDLVERTRGWAQGRFLSLGLALSLLLLTGAVAAGWWPVSLDRSLAAKLPGAHATGLPFVLLTVTSAITALAAPMITVLLTLVVAARWSWREGTAEALRAVASPLMALTVCVLAGKALLRRQGPPGSEVAHLAGYYPSGHTTTALVCTGTLALLAGQRHPTWLTRLRVASAVWTAIVASSLVLHRYHWLSDVIAAALLGTLILRGSVRAGGPVPAAPGLHSVRC